MKKNAVAISAKKEPLELAFNKQAKIKELESQIYTDQNKEIWRKHET